MPALAEIVAAATRLEGVSVKTPLLQSAVLDAAVGGRVLLKPECMQLTGSFKIRGAFNRLSRLSPEQSKNGVVAWSSGNHAQGVAAAGAMLGIRSTIVMPADAPEAKLANTRRLGGEVVTYDRYSGDREAIAREIAAARDAALVPSYDHDHIIAGQGTVGLEIADQTRAMDVRPDCVLIPCGGGGLSSGCAVALKASLPDVEIYAVEPRDFDDTARSLEGGRRVAIDPNARSICDALQSPMPGELTFPILQDHLQAALSVTDADVRSAMRFVFRELKLVVEPGGAVALAALLSGQIDITDRTAVVVLSGGNVDTKLFAKIQAEPD